MRPAGSRVSLLPAAFTVALASLSWIPAIRQNTSALATFLGTAIALGAWNVLLAVQSRHAGRKLQVEIVVRRQHWLQACAQGSVLVYWGWYWPVAHTYSTFIVAQLVFAYAFDMLFSWTRRDTYTFGFSVFPVIFSTNLFLWFKADWFYMQFAMVAVGLAAKELIRWNKEGRRVHIFNPSSFPLAVFSILLLATGKTGMTWGQEIATTQFYPPQMYLMLFLIGLPGQFFFGVASMTISAVVAAFAFSRLYFGMTGIYFFYDSYIPISVFLGMHLLFNDPSTSPRTELGRIIYGSLYGLSTAGLYALLGHAGMPTFYDKLLQVPFLNLSIKAIDRIARWKPLTRLDPAALGRSLAPRQRNLAYMSLWAAVFIGLSATQAVGDNHPGQWLPFWRQACQDGRAYACPYVADLELNFCNRGSAWACNDAGLMHIALAQSGEDLRRRDPAGAAEPLNRGCELGSITACQNLMMLQRGAGPFRSASPTLRDYPVILQGSKGPIRDRRPPALYALACREGWADACAIARP